MKIRTPAFALTAVAAATLLAACGGSGSNSSTNPGDTGQSPTVSDVLSSGVITEFGSVWVNGVRYATTGAQIISADDGTVINADLSDDQLRQYLGLGQVVTVRGSSSDDGSNGTAQAVFVDSEVVGPISSVSAATVSLVVVGQTIAISPDTIIDDSIIEAVIGDDTLSEDVRYADIEQAAGRVVALDELFATDMVVEVNGFRTPKACRRRASKTLPIAIASPSVPAAALAPCRAKSKSKASSPR